jgi:hypothetical protein
VDLCVLRTTERLGCDQYRWLAPFECAHVAILVEALRDPNPRSTARA